MRKVCSWVRWIGRHYGALGTLRWLSRSLPYYAWLHLTPTGRADLRFDRVHNVETDGVVEVVHNNRFGDSIHYAPSKPRWFLRVVSRLPIDPRKFVFVDIGAGKGRVLLLATHFPFKSILGIEYQPELAAVAKRNTASDKRIEVVAADATEYELPHDNLVLYLFNPFGRLSMASLLVNVERSLRDSARKIYFVYWAPMHADLLDGAGWLERIAFRRDMFAIYRNTGVESVDRSN
jgi:SAM-dependent methyltransferase